MITKGMKVVTPEGQGCVTGLFESFGQVLGVRVQLDREPKAEPKLYHVSRVRDLPS